MSILYWLDPQLGPYWDRPGKELEPVLEGQAKLFFGEP